MKKTRIFMFLLIVLVLTSCTSNSATIDNSSTIKTVYYDDVDISSLQDGLEMAIEIAEQSVVSIEQFGSSFFNTGTTTIGSGVIIGKIAKGLYNTYYVLTNRHVITYESGGSGLVAKTINVIINGEEYNASYIKYDNNVDLAIIAFNSSKEYVTAKIGDSVKLKRGHIVLAIGTPYKTAFFDSVTMGIVSYNGRLLEDTVFNSTQTINNIYIQHDASINPGNSGGGLFNINGELIGINTSKIWDYKTGIEGMGFAVPTQIVTQLFSEYMTN